MAFPSAVTASDYPTSVLRFGLLDIKPIEIRKTIKRAGVKFIRITRRLERLKPEKSYYDFVTLQNEAIFGAIDIPEWFDSEKLVKVFTERRISYYNTDKEYKRAVELLKKGEKSPGSLLSFINFAYERFKSMINDSLENEANRFLNSNFPLSFFSESIILDHTMLDYLKLLKKIVRHYDISSKRPRARSEFRIYARVIEDMKREIAPVIDQMDACLLSYICLDRYINIWNSKSYDDIFESKFLDINNLDYSAFSELFENFNSKHMETRKFLLDVAPEIFHSELDLENDPTAKMFSKLVTSPLPTQT